MTDQGNIYAEGTKNLNTYRTLFIIKAAFNCLLALCGIIYLVAAGPMGHVYRDQADRYGHSMPFDPGVVFLISGIVLLTLGITLAIVTFMAAAKIGKRQSRTFIIVAAAANCLTGVLGILLCIFTIIELQKPPVKAVFED